MKALRLCAAALALAVADTGATVYRCGNRYADVPCPQATVVDADDRRSDADRAAAFDIAQREAALAARMVAERERAERLLQPSRPARVAKPAARPASAPAFSRRSVRDRLRTDADGNVIVIIPKSR